jgi:hypothetical protein
MGAAAVPVLIAALLRPDLIAVHQECSSRAVVRVAAKCLRGLGVHAQEALPLLKKMQANYRRRGYRAIFGQSHDYKLVTDAIRKIEAKSDGTGTIKATMVAARHLRGH